MRYLSTLLLTLAISTGFAAAEEKPGAEDSKEKSVVHVDAPAAAKLLAEKDAKKRPVIIDIRTDEEFEAGHLKGAKQIDFLQDDFEEKVAKLDRKTPYLVHCRSGGRSTRSLEVWKKLGFEKIYHLDGGFLGWEKAELPVTK